MFQIQYCEHYWEFHDPKVETTYPLDIPVRAVLSRSILEDLERIVDKPFENAAQCKEEIKSIALKRKEGAKSLDELADSSKMTKRTLRRIEVNNNAVEHFLDFVDSISEEQMDTVEPLPYRRRLSEQESGEVRADLKEQWQFGGFYWVPLSGDCTRPLIIFDGDEFTEDHLPELKETILSLTSQRIYEIEEFGNDFEVDHTEFDPDKTEVIYTDKNFSWVIYTSHEDTIAFGGPWLLSEIEKRYADIIKPENRS